ncbi:MAG: phosphodiester glycosidase family protein, partial [Melioribacteraceae bacterium]|nr:phosphodiester glycosidase family protein [Melioribacteraceae bacterium]
PFDSSYGAVCKINKEGSNYIYCTSLPWCGKLALDKNGQVFTIYSLSNNYIKVCGFNADGSDTLFTFFSQGGSGKKWNNDIALDSNGNIYITGTTNSLDFPVVNAYQTQSTNDNSEYVKTDTYVMKIAMETDQLVWENITGNYSVPAGINVFKGIRDKPKLEAYYIDADLNIPEISVRPYMRGSKTNVKNFNYTVGAYASINGGFFDLKSSNIKSAVVYPEKLKAKNVAILNREVNDITRSYPVVRSLFSMKKDRTFSVDWIYHHGQAYHDIFRYDQPLQYERNDENPLSKPKESDGQPYGEILTGIGGGPVLIKDGKINVTYNEEILWGSGVGYSNHDPRSAVGYTADKHIIFLVADGRTSKSEGVGLPELAQIMLDLGCVEAMNLDGGGSSQLAIGNSFVNDPKEFRPVPSIFSIVHTDSLNLDKEPQLYRFVDTESDNVEKVGNWTESQSPGAYGSSNSLIIPAGEGNSYIAYNLKLAEEADYELYAWWVEGEDRCTDTPYIISHKNGTDTVLVDQSYNGSFWNIIGNYTFTGTNTDVVKITDGGTSGYISADAISI